MMHLQAHSRVSTGHPQLLLHLADLKEAAGFHQKEQEREHKMEATAF